MTKTQGTLVALLLAVLVALDVYSLIPPPPPTYEYRIEFTASAVVLGSYGADGWQVVSARWASTGEEVLGRDWGYEVVLMRERGRYSALP